MFAYREALTGFSPFELLYEEDVRGPLDVLKERWEVNSATTESVVCHLLQMRERMEQMTGLVKENMRRAQRTQKTVILLPSSTNKLLAHWQGPYTIIRKLGKLTFQVDMHDKRKRHRVFHVNLLKKWNPPMATACLTEELYAVADKATTAQSEEDILSWKGEDLQSNEFVMGEQLSVAQRTELQQLLTTEYGDVLQSQPGRTSLTHHTIHTGTVQLSRLTPYRIPHAYREAV